MKRFWLRVGAFLFLACSTVSFTGCLSPLVKATIRGNTQEIFPLLAKRLSVRSSNPQGRELVVAILQGRREAAIHLAQSGADVNAVIINNRYYDGYTPVILASWSGDEGLVRILAAKGADLNARSHSNECALGKAAYRGKIESVRTLLDLGADPNIDTDSLSGPPLAQAALQGHLEIVRLLIAHGADVEKARLALEGLARINSRYNYAASIAVVGKANQAVSLLRRLSPRHALVPEARRIPAAAPSPEPAAAAVASDVDRFDRREKQRPDDFALIIGIEKYESIPNADFGQRDAEVFRRYVLGLGVPEENVISLSGPKATKTGITKYLEEWLPRNVTAGSRVYFYYSGHGAPDAATGAAYLVPYDGDPTFLRSSAYPLPRLYEKLGALKAKEVVIALDSCFSGAGGRSVIAKGARPLMTVTAAMATGPKLSVLTASASDEISGSLDDQGHGLFTYYLLKGLKGEADADTDGHVTLGELHGFIHKAVQRSARRQNREQTPQFSSTKPELKLY